MSKEVKAHLRLLDPADIREYSLWLFFGSVQSNVTRHHMDGPQPLNVWRDYLREKMGATLKKRTPREYDVILPEATKRNPRPTDALGKRWIICGHAKNGAEYYFSGNSRKPLGGRFVRDRSKATTLQTKFAASEVARHLRPYLYGIGLESLEVKPE